MVLKTKIFTNNGISVIYRNIGCDNVDFVLVPERFADKAMRDDCKPEPLVQAKIVGDSYPDGFAQGRTMRNSSTVQGMHFVSQNCVMRGKSSFITTVLEDSRHVQYIHNLQFGACSSTIEITTEVKNCGNKPVTLEMLSSFTLGSLSPLLTGLAAESMRIHRLHSTWSAEGRLITERPEDLQLEPDWQQHSANSLRFGSVGSFPVREWAPFIAIEDIVNNVTWAVSTTHASSWQMEIYRRDNGLSISGGIADREFGHWMHTINPGESFTAPSAIATVVQGGVDLASQCLLEHTRENLSLPKNEKAYLPIIFNEYCSTWGLPTEKSVLSQSKIISKHDIDYVVIDAGWFDHESFDTAIRFGKWCVDKQSFPHGMKYVVERLHNLGLKVGIWFEFEAVGEDEESLFNRTQWLLKRDGVPITSGQRRFWDMRNKNVREYLRVRVIDFLKENKIDYLKVDYNDSIGIGCETVDCDYRCDYNSLGDGLYSHIQATMSFFDEIRKSLPNLVIEICSAGGHRLVQSFMQIASMASFSDAHECIESPIIAANMHRMILPRQSQIWAVMRENLDENAVIYRLCTGFLGRLCLSGDVESLSDWQWRLIDKAIGLYQKINKTIDRGISSWIGSGIVSYRSPKGWQAIIRKPMDCNNPLFVVLHTFAKSPCKVILPIPHQFVDKNIETFMSESIKISFDGDSLCISNLHDFEAAVIVFD